jgi:hypothetical protein
MIVNSRCEEEDTFLGRYRGVTEDLRGGKIEIRFQVDGGRVAGFSEPELHFQAVN